MIFAKIKPRRIEKAGGALKMARSQCLTRIGSKRVGL
jgi:hypothetical protein